MEINSRQIFASLAILFSCGLSGFGIESTKAKVDLLVPYDFIFYEILDDHDVDDSDLDKFREWTWRGIDLMTANDQGGVFGSTYYPQWNTENERYIARASAINRSLVFHMLMRFPREERQDLLAALKLRNPYKKPSKREKDGT